LITYGGKRVENRTRRTSYHGTLLIHAALHEDRSAIHTGLLALWPDVLGCHEAEDGCCAPWGRPGMWHWEVGDVRPLDTPVPARGALGLWRPTPTVLEQVEAQYTEMEVAW
jgi:hypothetical protein